jgi:hypothetical protein
VALDEGNAKLFFKVADLGAQGRLRHVERLRGACHVAGLDQLPEIAELPKVDGRLPPSQSDLVAQAGHGDAAPVVAANQIRLPITPPASAARCPT